MTPLRSRRLAPALALGAAEHLIGGHTEKPGDDLGERERLAVAVLAGVGRQQLERLLADTALGVDLELEGLREAFAALGRRACRR